MALRLLNPVVETFSVELGAFTYGNYNIIYPKPYFQFIKEVFILDVYRTNLLKENDLVLDLGASTGDFCFIASKRVGIGGKVIAVEPDLDNYKLLKLNIQRNNCKNIIPINSAVGKEQSKKKIIAPCNKNIVCKVNTLEDILEELDITQRINFIKMDIEGMEDDVISHSIETVKKADVISLELHGTKEMVDQKLIPHFFLFKPITMRYVYKKILKNLLLHPANFYDALTHTIKENPNTLHKAITGFDLTKNHLLVGSYIKYNAT